MSELFELEWCGGSVERSFRRAKPIDALPWGTLDARCFPAHLVARARDAWTQAAWTEYCTAAAFAEVLRSLLAVRAPVDLVGMAGGFVADEMLHVELNSRMAMELGGGVAFTVDFAALAPRTAPDLSPFERASELVVRTCCVAETFSAPLLAATLRSAAHPLTRAVLARIVRDEGPHAAFGWRYLEWASGRMSPGERERLGEVASSAIDTHMQVLARLPSDAHADELAHVHALGWLSANPYAKVARAALKRRVLGPLARHGIVARGAPGSPWYRQYPVVG